MAYHTGSIVNAPTRRVISMVGTDHGMLNGQLSCGHVFWWRPKTEDAVSELADKLARFQAGETMFDPCFACYDGLIARYPVGVKLPVPEPTR